MLLYSVFRGTTLGWPLPSLGSVDFHGPLVTDLVLRRLLVPVSALLFRQRLEVPRDDLRDLAELGLGIGGLDVVPRGVGVQEEAALVALGGVGVLLLLGPLLLLGGVGVGVGIGLGCGRRIVALHGVLVAFLVLDGELIPASPL